MSPEQREGRPGDYRSDVYSFGVLLCEVLTGRLPQPGDTLADLLGRGPPAWASTLFERCHCRYERRFGDAREALAVLKEVLNNMRGEPMFRRRDHDDEDEDDGADDQMEPTAHDLKIVEAMLKKSVEIHKAVFGEDAQPGTCMDIYDRIMAYRINRLTVKSDRDEE